MTKNDTPGGRPLITRRTVEIAVRRLLRFAQGHDLSTVTSDDGKFVRAFVDTGRVAACGKLLEQWRWEAERSDKHGEKDTGAGRYARMSDAELAAEQAKADKVVANYAQETRQ